MVYYNTKMELLTIEKMKESKDDLSTLDDLVRIKSAVQNLMPNSDFSYAYNLDYEMRAKYSCINTFCELLNRVEPPSPTPCNSATPVEVVRERLKVDAGGILADMAIKKGITDKLANFIFRVD